MTKKIKVVFADDADLEKYVDKTKLASFTKRFVPIESTYRIRTIIRENKDVRLYSFELVDKKYCVIQKVELGKDNSKIQQINEKLLKLGVKKKVIDNGVKEFYRKYNA